MSMRPASMPRLQGAAGRVCYNLKFPHILGRDFSGVVAAGRRRHRFRGRRRGIRCHDAGIEGAYAEKLAIKAAIVARKPDRLSHPQAAAMALTGITAIWAIEDTAQLQAGETILIQGGAGGVAGFAIQLARSRRHSGHDDQRRQRRLCSRPRGRPHDRLQRRGLHQDSSACDVVFDTVGDEVQVRRTAS